MIAGDRSAGKVRRRGGGRGGGAWEGLPGGLSYYCTLGLSADSKVGLSKNVLKDLDLVHVCYLLSSPMSMMTRCTWPMCRMSCLPTVEKAGSIGLFHGRV